eukprot:1949855-Rhodomonas_salina.10
MDVDFRLLVSAADASRTAATLVAAQSDGTMAAVCPACAHDAMSMRDVCMHADVGCVRDVMSRCDVDVCPDDVYGCTRGVS